MADTDSSSYDQRYNLIAQRQEDFRGSDWYKSAVPTLAFTNVGADIGSSSGATAKTTVFTPTVSGMYLYSFYGLATTAPTGADAAPNLYLVWTDEHGTQKYFNFAGNLDATYTDGPNSVTIPIYAVAGTPIWFYTAAGNYSSTIKWSFYFTVTAI